MINTFKVARELGYLVVHADEVVDGYDMGDLPPEKIVVLSTGSQGEPLSALARIANGEHRTVHVEEGDTVVISASPVPGNERAVNRVINRLFKAGARIFHKGVATVHVSGHGASEELKLMLSLIRPRFFMPVHGETRHLQAHSEIAQQVGVAPQNIFIMENGDCLELSAASASRCDKVESGVFYVDGLSVGEAGTGVLRDRQHMASDGIAVVVIAVDRRSGRSVGETELIMRGVAMEEEIADVYDGALERIAKVMARIESERATDARVIERALREGLSQFLWEKLRRRPIILPTVLEV